MAAVKELGYLPNRMAQGLRLGRTNTVALAVGDIEQNVYSTVAKHLQLALETDRRDMMLYNLGHSEARLVSLFENARILGLLAIVLATSDELPRELLADYGDKLAKDDVALISVHQNVSALGIPSVIYDDVDAVRRSVLRLLAAGRKPVAYLGRISHSAIGSSRYQGYLDALAEADVPLEPRLVWDVYYRHQAGYDALMAACRAGLAFQGVQAGSDELAMGAAGALIDQGRLVPDDVAVVGFGDIQSSAYFRPSITSTTSHPEAIAEHVRSILNAFSEGLDPPLLTKLERKLVLRTSA